MSNFSFLLVFSHKTLDIMVHRDAQLKCFFLVRLLNIVFALSMFMIELKTNNKQQTCLFGRKDCADCKQDLFH